MSQAKVNAYKESKKNRKHDILKAKRTKTLRKVIAVLVCALVAFWIGHSSYNIWKSSQPLPTYELSYSAIEDYINDVVYASGDETEDTSEDTSEEETYDAAEDTSTDEAE